jgi:hypothetical protein
MSTNKLVRNKVIISKSSLEVLAELNRQAEHVDCAVVIGVLVAETSMLGGTTTEDVPFYMIIEEGMFKEPMKDFEKSHIAMNKEEALTKLLSFAKQGGK